MFQTFYGQSCIQNRNCNNRHARKIRFFQPAIKFLSCYAILSTCLVLCSSSFTVIRKSLTIYFMQIYVLDYPLIPIEKSIDIFAYRYADIFDRTLFTDSKFVY